MQINQVILNIFDGFLATPNNKVMTKYDELESVKIEKIYAKVKGFEKPKTLLKTIDYKLDRQDIAIPTLNAVIQFWTRRRFCDEISTSFNLKLYLDYLTIINNNPKLKQ